MWGHACLFSYICVHMHVEARDQPPLSFLLHHLCGFFILFCLRSSQRKSLIWDLTSRLDDIETCPRDTSISLPPQQGFKPVPPLLSFVGPRDRTPVLIPAWQECDVS